MTRSIEQRTVRGPRSLPHVVRVEVVRHFTLRLEFDDGFVGDIDLEAYLEGPVFGALRDPALFGQVKVDPEMRTLVWPNGADLAPEFLREQTRPADA